MKKLISRIILGVILISLTTCMVVFIFDEHYNESGQIHCGIVQDISTQLKDVKYGTKTKYFLLVQFPTIGKRTINVNNHTFLTSPAGSEVCFTLSNSFAYGHKRTFGDIGYLFGLITTSIYILLTLFLLVYGLYKLVNIALSWSSPLLLYFVYWLPLPYISSKYLDTTKKYITPQTIWWNHIISIVIIKLN